MALQHSRSNTEPLLRLNIEARKPDLVDQIRKEIEEIIETSQLGFPSQRRNCARNRT